MSDHLSRLYESDYSAWATRNIELLRGGRFADVDLEHVIEELEGMSKSDRNELVSHLVILLAHLLKWQFQLDQLREQLPGFAGQGWRSTIIEQRVQMERQLEDQPSLRGYFPTAVIKAYPYAVKLACRETGLPASHFPGDCPFSLPQLLDPEFFPA
jgi:hypothetical protein